MKKIFVAILFLLISLLVLKAQTLQPVHTIELSEKPLAFSVDPFGAIYIVASNGNIIKYDTTGNPVSLPCRKTKSSEWQIDAGNPYKIIVFNRDLQVADIYNSNFSAINSIDFTDLEVGDISLLCSSYDNSFWTLSAATMDLMRFSEQWSITSQTNANMLLNEDGFEPDILKESDSKLLLAHRRGSAYIFDLYGNMLLHFPKKADTWSLDTDILYYLQNDSIHVWHTRLHEETILLLNETIIDDFTITASWFAVLSGKKIILFRKN